MLKLDKNKDGSFKDQKDKSEMEQFVTHVERERAIVEKAEDERKMK